MGSSRLNFIKPTLYLRDNKDEIKSLRLNLTGIKKHIEENTGVYIASNRTLRGVAKAAGVDIDDIRRPRATKPARRESVSCAAMKLAKENEQRIAILYDAVADMKRRERESLRRVDHTPALVELGGL